VTAAIGLVVLASLMGLFIWNERRTSRLKRRARELKELDWESERRLREKQIEDLRRVYGRQFMDFCGSAREESERREINIWRVYYERAYACHAMAYWNAWCLMWGVVGAQYRLDYGKACQDPGDESV